MPKGISLHIGLNSVDPNHYQGWSGVLLGCENDAKDMATIATSNGFSKNSLITLMATRKAVSDAISDISTKLTSGDIFFLSYSGHGNQVPDLNGDEPSGYDQTWCLFDGQMLDDELNYYFSKFAAGVRIFVLSDSCYSGSIVKDVTDLDIEGDQLAGYRIMPPDVGDETYRVNKQMYEKIGTNPLLKNARASVTASLILISGCQDDQLSADGPQNGLFTGYLKAVWNGGSFTGSYRDFHHRIKKEMPPKQLPTYLPYGTHNPQFEMQKPFTI